MQLMAKRPKACPQSVLRLAAHQVFQGGSHYSQLVQIKATIAEAIFEEISQCRRCAFTEGFHWRGFVPRVPTDIQALDLPAVELQEEAVKRIVGRLSPENPYPCPAASRERTPASPPPEFRSAPRACASSPQALRAPTLMAGPQVSETSCRLQHLSGT
ncbi:unnamed protein product [Polarella glacialis]|uniref:Uncharacterized protein n=1 Tax=Polarella glacialis TaxID=89957 RepID=A0A813FWQ5_POLGL|nr:unnamed protein product [Polarella glacialis]